MGKDHVILLSDTQGNWALFDFDSITYQFHTLTSGNLTPVKDMVLSAVDGAALGTTELVLAQSFLTSNDVVSFQLWKMVSPEFKPIKIGNISVMDQVSESEHN